MLWTLELVTLLLKYGIFSSRYAYPFVLCASRQLPKRCPSTSLVAFPLVNTFFKLFSDAFPKPTWDRCKFLTINHAPHRGTIHPLFLFEMLPRIGHTVGALKFISYRLLTLSVISAISYYRSTQSHRFAKTDLFWCRAPFSGTAAACHGSKWNMCSMRV